MAPSDQAPSGFAGLAGVEWLDAREEEAHARIEVEEHHKQPYGFVHGGVFATLAESVASHATAAASGMAAIGMSNNTTFMRPVTRGQIDAVARRRHAGRTTWVWDVEMTDGEGRLCALSRMTIAVRELDGG
ncbi:MAG: PaaI family thioesterase [Solirubrobacterales bacterium]